MICSFATATSMAVLYGYNVAPKGDPFVAKIDHFIGLFSTALTPEMAALLLAFPFCTFTGSLLYCHVDRRTVSGVYSILAPWRNIQAASCRMSCARK